MLKPGFFEHVQKVSLLLKQKLASVVDRYPSVLSEVRGEGLLIGVKAACPRAISSPRCATRSCSPSAPATTSCVSSHP